MATVVKTRSLTKRRSSSVKSTQESIPEPPPVPDIPDMEANGDANHTEEDTAQPKSPLLTSRRLSTSSLDNVSLDEDEAAAKPTTPPKGMAARLRLIRYSRKLAANEC